MAEEREPTSQEILDAQRRSLFLQAAAIVGSMLVIAGAAIYLTAVYLPAKKAMEKLESRIQLAMDSGEWGKAERAAGELAQVNEQAAARLMGRIEERRRLAYHYFEFRVLDTYDIHDQPVTGIAFAPDGEHAVSESTGGEARMWRLDTGEVVDERADIEPRRMLTAFTSSGQIMATADNAEQIIRVLKLPSANVISRIQAPAQINGVDISQNGSYIAAATADSTVRIWYRPDGSLVSTLRSDPLAVTAVTFAPDGRALLTGTSTGEVALWGVP